MNMDSLNQMAQSMPMPDLANYSADQFIADMATVKPRVFENYIMPFFLVAFAIRAGTKKPLGKLARRMLFTSGVYMFYRNFANYKAATDRLATYIKPGDANAPA